MTEFSGGRSVGVGPEGGGWDAGSRRDIEGARVGGRRLPPGVAEVMGRRLGADLGRVRVHTDARADRSAESLNAQAFTTGHAPHAGPGSSGTGHPVQRKMTLLNVRSNLRDWRAIRLALGREEIPMPSGWEDLHAAATEDALKRRVGELVGDSVERTFDLDDEGDLRRLAALITGRPQASGPGDVPPPLAPTVAQVAPGHFSVEYLNKSNRAEVRTILRAWVRYAADHEKGLSTARWDLYAERERRRRDQAYYPGDTNFAASSDAKAFRDKYKEVHNRAVHMRGALNEAKQVAKALTTMYDSKVIGVLRDSSGKIQGVVELMDSKYENHVYVSNLAANPENIDSANPVKKVAEAALVFAVLQSRKSQKDRVKLVALNNKVKSIYDYFGFRVHDKGVPVPHPKGLKEQEPSGARYPAKHPIWHTKQKMTLRQDDGTKLLGRGRALLDVLPDELRNVV
ncbi:DUF4157 domain-containing protein [Sphaerisporangium flaviroseum]|uniref:eCIS core domain-containing protein n=1 Tax=Sphaerisporangium flaviroseum TaxID=509199 RepID=UPI0031E85D7D